MAFVSASSSRELHLWELVYSLLPTGTENNKGGPQWPLISTPL